MTFDSSQDDWHLNRKSCDDDTEVHQELADVSKNTDDHLHKKAEVIIDS